MRRQLLRPAPEPARKPCGIRRPKCGRLRYRRPHHVCVEHIRLELHQRLAAHHAAIHAQFRQRNAGILRHRAHHIHSLIRGCFQRGAAKMRAVGVARQPADQATRVLPPIRRVQPGKRRHDVHAAAVLHASRQRIHLGRRGDQPEAVAQPLHKRAGYGDGAFQGVGGRRRAQLVGDSGDQPVLGRHRHQAGVEQQEVACAIRVLGFPRRETHLANQCGLLVADQRHDRHAAHCVRRAHERGRGDDLRQAGAGDTECFQQRRAPIERLQIHQLRAAGVGDIGRVPATQIPREPGIDGAEQRVASLGARARAGHVVEQPLQFQGGEVAGQRQAGLCLEACLAAIGRVFGHQCIGARILPHQRAVQRTPGVPVPQQRGLALVGDADRG